MQSLFRYTIYSFIIVTLSCTIISATVYNDFQLNFKGSTLTLQAHNTPLKDVLHEFEKQSKIRVRFMLPISDIVTAEFDNIPVTQAIKLLLRNYNHSVTYTKFSDKSGRFISEIFVASRTASHSTPLVWQPADSGFTALTVSKTFVP